MRRIRIMASRKAWLRYLNAPRAGKAGALYRYNRIVAYECQRNGTANYTPYWAA